MVFVPPMTREERRSLVLHEAIAERLVREPALVIDRARKTLSTMRTAHRHAEPLLREWAHLLRSSVTEIVDAILDPRPHARELRHVTPFAGVLTARERARIYARFRAMEAA